MAFLFLTLPLPPQKVVHSSFTRIKCSWFRLFNFMHPFRYHLRYLKRPITSEIGRLHCMHPIPFGIRFRARHYFAWFSSYRTDNNIASNMPFLVYIQMNNTIPPYYYFIKKTFDKKYKNNLMVIFFKTTSAATQNASYVIFLCHY